MVDIAKSALLAILLTTGTTAVAQDHDDARSLGVRNGQAGDAEAGNLGLTVALNRGEPVYAVGESLVLTIRVSRPATIEVWELDQTGKLDRIVSGAAATPGTPLVLPGGGQRFTVAEPAGTSELRVIARAVSTGSQRSIGDADSRLAQRSLREERRLTYRIVAR